MTVKSDPWPEQNFYFRSDHLNLARVGVPALFMIPGIDHKQFGADWGMQQIQKYLQQHYHQVSDEYSDAWNLDGIMDYLQITFDIGYTLANSDKFPNWVKNDDFRLIRDASRAELKGE
jgi:Zn-dependent M28 family amino/carboxypeptidase